MIEDVRAEADLGWPNQLPSGCWRPGGSGRSPPDKPFCLQVNHRQDSLQNIGHSFSKHTNTVYNWHDTGSFQTDERPSSLQRSDAFECRIFTFL
jgi:hypothetical protein